MYPRLREVEMQALPGESSLSRRRRATMAVLADQKIAPGLMAFGGDASVSWIAVVRVGNWARVDRSLHHASRRRHGCFGHPVYDVRKGVRGRGTTLAMIAAAVEYAATHHTSAVEVYSRAGAEWTSDDKTYLGPESMFRRAGFRVIREPPSNLPLNWTPCVTMRINTPTSLVR